jgi:hypothetical protein
MIIEEQKYADYLFLLPINETAQSWERVDTNAGVVVQEIDYQNYLNTVGNADESTYAVFSNLYDRINISLHQDYFAAFEIIGYAIYMDGMCKRKKEPAK